MAESRGIHIGRRFWALIGLAALLGYAAWIGAPYLHLRSVVVRDAAVTTWIDDVNSPIRGYVDKNFRFMPATVSAPTAVSPRSKIRSTMQRRSPGPKRRSRGPSNASAACRSCCQRQRDAEDRYPGPSRPLSGKVGPRHGRSGACGQRRPLSAARPGQVEERSGRVVFVEIVLTFEPGLTIAEVNRRIAALKQSMADEIAHADISILTTGATAA